jgi:DNA-binding response OmpR family regulator
VLIVEDEPDTREFLERFLRACGADTIATSSSAAALALVSSSRPHILVSDIGLPDMDGYDLIQRVRQLNGNGATLPAIALTAYARSDDRKRALDAGYQAHMPKPAEPRELAARIASLARRHPG